MEHKEKTKKKSRKRDKQSMDYILKSLLAGGIAGCAAKTAIAPLDRVKILFQTSNPRFEKYSGSFFGVFRAGHDILNIQGWKGLFQGHSATLLRIFPYAAIKFMAYEQLKYSMMPTKESETQLKKFMAGALAGCTSVFFSYPLDVLRVRLALEFKREGSVSLYSTIQMIYNEPLRFSFIGGVGNFYRGFMPTLYGMIPYAGVSFLTYENLKKFAYQHLTLDTQTQHEPKRLRAWAYLACGALSGAIAQTSSYPLEVIRRVMQVSGSTAYSEKLDYTSTFQTAKDIYKRKGFKGFWVGLSIGYLKVAPMFAISFYVYEYMKKTLEID